MTTREWPFLLILAALLVVLTWTALLGYYRLDRKTGIIDTAAETPTAATTDAMTMDRPAGAPTHGGVRCDDVSFVVEGRLPGMRRPCAQKSASSARYLSTKGADARAPSLRSCPAATASSGLSPRPPPGCSRR
jgi:hypothetical protein